jgi:pimeloyl-ACP methyl ester carboxylesterase
LIKEEPLTLTTEDGANVEVCLYTDDSKRPQTAITIMHPTTDWRQHFILRPLAERGIAALGFTTRYSRREAELVLEHTILDMAAGVKFLRARGYERVCSIGNSGGGEIVAVYQSQVENPTITATPLGDPPDLTKAELPPIDGLIFLNAHPGRAHSLTESLDPSVGGEDRNDPFKYDPSLDMYNPENGPPYSKEFQARYEKAQIERNHKITRWCQRKLKELETVGNPRLTDATFLVHRTVANLKFLDFSIDPSDRSGLTIWDETPALANYTPGPLRGNHTRLRIMTLRSWISQRGLATSHFDVYKHAPHCHVPTLVVVGTADATSTPSRARQVLDHVPGEVKKFVTIKDGTHFMRGQVDKQLEAADSIAQWLREIDMA